MYATIVQNNKFVYILYTKNVQIKFCMIMNVQKTYIKFLHIYKKGTTNCTKIVQSLD